MAPKQLNIEPKVKITEEIYLKKNSYIVLGIAAIIVIAAIAITIAIATSPHNGKPSITPTPSFSKMLVLL